MLITENDILENIVPATKEIIESYVKKEALHFSHNPAFKQLKITGHMESSIILIKKQDTWVTFYFNLNNVTYFADVNVFISETKAPTVAIYPIIKGQYGYETITSDITYLAKTK